MDLNTWIISDTHFGHDNIVKYCNRPENHNELMISRWHETVGENDKVLHLGDVIFGPSEKTYYDELSKLPGEKVMIWGNHDHKKPGWYVQYGLSPLQNNTYIYENWKGQRVLISHYPDTQRYDWDINIHGHIHNGGYAPGTPKQFDYRNVSVEVMDYTPVRLIDILENGKYQSREKAGDWKHSNTVEMLKKGRLTEQFTEKERYR